MSRVRIDERPESGENRSALGRRLAIVWLLSDLVVGDQGRKVLR